MTVDKKDLIEALHTSAQELQQGIAMHRCLVASFLDGQVDEENVFGGFMEIETQCILTTDNYYSIFRPRWLSL